jgi:hypothetical protein
MRCWFLTTGADWSEFHIIICKSIDFHMFLFFLLLGHFL